ncbi:DNA ligase [Paenibacillus antri]|uniref:DNA ligase n=1 Tax=Paenibacillus antri TaxID=2582848 RepID=A0A5R9FX20_9BACL|nr:DNA ligase [Paenibacillus antri]TLS48562.1 DNA ligase [Paenibacillus antri]
MSSPPVPFVLPAEPMGPISRDDIPEGPDWGYQLKWDGVRALAVVDDGRVELYSRKLLRKEDTYPEVVRRLRQVEGSYVLDGEIVYFDAALGRPVFQKVLQRERTRAAAALARSSAEQPVSYVLFDLLAANGEDLRSLPYAERYARLRAAFPPDGDPSLFVTDLFDDGPGLWRWVEERGWEGIVSKRLSAPYAEGKKHRDAYKKRAIQRYDARCIGVVFREGRVASLALAYEGAYFGRASLGLNERSRSALASYAAAHRAAQSPFAGGAAPADLKRETVVWLDRPFLVAVTGLEVTADGLLRHPKLADPPALERFLAAPT